MVGRTIIFFNLLSKGGYVIMKKMLFTMFLFAFFSFSSSLVLAQDTPKKGPLAKMDTNKDGKISKDEFMTFHLEQARKRGEMLFNKADANTDGVLSREEIIEVFSAIREHLEQRNMRNRGNKE